jgi:glucosyl-3-phosphoglycerate synthase
MWKSLYACTGEIICWVDADLRNFRGEYIERLCAPLLAQPETMFVKAYFTRSFEGAPTGGGRVTELVARPLLSLLFPKLADIVQPLGGEYAARRAALEVLPFVEGWGVELGLLVDVVERFGRDAVAQVDLDAREHRNRPLTELGPQALAVMTIALRRAGLLPGATAPFVELLRADPDGTIEGEPVEVRERPPIITLPAYRARFSPPR